MKRLPTEIAEKVYRLLKSKLGASSDYYESEAFIYHYTLVKSAPEYHQLKCADGLEREFHCNSKGEMWVTGEGVDSVNAILRQIGKDLNSIKKIGEFTVTTK